MLSRYARSMGMARQLSMGILGQQIEGIWHTGIVVYGREYFFGGGIQNLPHTTFVASYGIQPTRMIELGSTVAPVFMCTLASHDSFFFFVVCMYVCM